VTSPTSCILPRGRVRAREGCRRAPVPGVMLADRPTQKQVIVGIAVGVGLLHFATGPGYRGPCGWFVNGYLIDVLLPFAMYLLLSLCGPPFRFSGALRAAAVLCVGVIVEVLQFFDVPLFGRTFDPVDFMMYGLGVAGGAAFERAVLSRLGPGRRGGTPSQET
jgi:hypothetical protein